MKLSPILLALALTLPSMTSAQLTYNERRRAEELARIQAKADAKEQAKRRRIRLEVAQASCRSHNRRWDYANELCKPR